MNHLVVSQAHKEITVKEFLHCTVGAGPKPEELHFEFREMDADQVVTYTTSLRNVNMALGQKVDIYAVQLSGTSKWAIFTTDKGEPLLIKSPKP